MALGFRVLGFRALGFRVLGLRVLGFRLQCARFRRIRLLLSALCHDSFQLLQSSANRYHEHNAYKH